jgi:hypothetical protein
MKMPRSAIGKKGMCPTCGRTLSISSSSTSQDYVRKTERPTISSGQSTAWDGPGLSTEQDVKQAFGRAADLFCEGRYGEALVIFDALAQKYPGNPDIENAREQCLASRKKGPISLPGPEGSYSQDAGTLRQQVQDKLVEKMHHGRTEAVQLKAAELLGKMLGFFEHDPTQGSGQAAPDHSDGNHGGNGHSKDLGKQDKSSEEAREAYDTTRGDVDVTEG